MRENQQQTLDSVDLSGILNAIHAGNLTPLQTFHTSHPDIHFSSIRYQKAGDTILHVSARLGHLDIVRYILENYKPCAVDCKSSDHKTALHEAAQFAQWRCAQTLLEYGAEVNALKQADWTPLMLACTKTNGCGLERYKMVELLAAKGALVNFKNKDGWTAAHLLAREGNINIFNLLRNQYGLNITTKTNNGRTILHIAALHGHINFLEVINTNTPEELHLDTPDQCGNTAIHEACLGGHCDVLKWLTSTPTSDYQRVNKAGFNCLHLAAGAGHCNVVRLLLEDLKFDANASTLSGGLTALHLAARKKFDNVYEILTSFGAAEEAVDHMGRTALDYRKMKI